MTDTASTEFAKPRGPKPAPKPPRRRRRLRALAIALMIVGVLLLGATIAVFAVFGTLQRWDAELPPIASADELWQVRRTPGMTFLDRSGAVIARRGPRYGTEVRVPDLPLHVRRAFLAAEDVRFYEHGPVDFQAIVRAVWANIRAGRTVQGASTLTQQLARTLFLTPADTLKRKVQEMLLARRLEGLLGKDGVLALYLNRTFFGDNAYGLEAAAQVYFGKSARELTLGESALLAAVPNAPSRLALTNDMSGALARSRRILAIMVEQGWITQAQMDQAVADPPVLNQTNNPAEGEFAYFINLAARQAGDLSQGGAADLIVQLTVDQDLQNDAAQIVRRTMATEGRGRNATQAALVALAPDGAVRAMVGGVNSETSVFNRVVQARRQPGSSFKPFVFAAALERGVRPSDRRDDSPLQVGTWRPQNYGGGFSGRVSVQQALARSINTVAVRLGLEVGTSALANFARRFGLTEIPATAGPSLALGAYEVTPLSMAGGYQVFQSGGMRTTPYIVSQISDTRGNVLYAAAPGAGLPVYDRFHASQMVRMMQTVITQGTGRRAAIGRPAAGKTGTSQNWRDAWFVGFTPDWVAAVWVGNDNGRSMNHVTGGELPAIIWRQFMLRAHRDIPRHDFTWLMPEPPANPDYNPDAGLQETSGAPPVDAPYTGSGATDANPYEDLATERLPPLPSLTPLRRSGPPDRNANDGLPPIDEPRDMATPPRRSFDDDDPPSMRRELEGPEDARRPPRPRYREPDTGLPPRWDPDDPDDTAPEDGPIERNRF